MTTQRTKLSALLLKLKACPEAREWAAPYATLQDAWDACERPDWMLWLIAELDKGYSPRLRLTACDIARTALKYVPAGEDSPRLAIECAERYARGEATADELAATRDAARAAARAAAGAAAWAAAGTAALDAARAAAWAAVGTAAWAAAWDAQCHIIRARIPNPEVTR